MATYDDDDTLTWQVLPQVYGNQITERLATIRSATNKLLSAILLLRAGGEVKPAVANVDLLHFLYCRMSNNKDNDANIVRDLNIYLFVQTTK